MTKREFLIKWKIDKEFSSYRLHFIDTSYLIFKPKYDTEDNNFIFIENDINNYIELLNDYKNIDWDNN